MRTALVVLALLIAAGGTLFALRDDESPGLTVRWGGSERVPSCAYDAATESVSVRLIAEGKGSAEVTVTAYADENTSQPVGSVTRRVSEPGRLRLTLPVTAPAHRGEDGETACRLEVGTAYR